MSPNDLQLAPLAMLFSSLAMEQEGIMHDDAALAKWDSLPGDSEVQEQDAAFRQDFDWYCKRYFDTDILEYRYECYKKAD